MKDILLCTKSKTLVKHWQDAIIDIYPNVIVVTTDDGLKRSLSKCINAIVLLDSNFFVDYKKNINTILNEYPNANILYMNDCPNFIEGKELLLLGVKGYANSRLSSTFLIQAITFINDDKIWLYPDFIQKLIKDAAISTNLEDNNIDSLTNKEKQVAQLVSEGCSNKVIAEKLKITESTTKVHLKNIFNKLNVTDRLSLALAIR